MKPEMEQLVASYSRMSATTLAVEERLLMAQLEKTQRELAACRKAMKRAKRSVRECAHA